MASRVLVRCALCIVATLFIFSTLQAQDNDPFGDADKQPLKTKKVEKKSPKKQPTKKKPDAVHLNLSNVEKIEAALKKVTSLEFVDMPLNEVITYMQEDLGINIQLDTVALDEVSIADDSPATIQLSGTSLRSAMRIMLRDLELTYIIRDEVLLITTPEVAENNLELKAYQVGDLILPGSIDSNKKTTAIQTSFLYSDSEPLIDLIPIAVQQESWDEVGGRGSIKSYNKDVLMINQTRVVHEEVEFLLKALRNIPVLSKQQPGKVYPAQTITGQYKQVQKIKKALAKKTSLEFIDMPLHEVVTYMKTDLGINIKLDEVALDEVSIATDSPVTIQLSNVTLKSALRIMLRDLELSYIIRDEVLLITTPEVAENNLSIVIYPVGDLLEIPYSDDGKQDFKSIDFSNLIDAITTSVTPESWDEVGGPGSLPEFQQRGAIIINQTEEVHAKLAEFLTKLRIVHAQSTQKPAAKPDPNEIVVRTYKYRNNLDPAMYGGGFGGGGGGGGLFQFGGGGFVSPPKHNDSQKLSELKNKLASAIKELKSSDKSAATLEEIKKLVAIAKSQQKLLSSMEAKETAVNKKQSMQSQIAKQTKMIANQFLETQDAHFPDHVAIYLEDRAIIKTTRKTHAGLQKLLIDELKLVSRQIK